VFVVVSVYFVINSVWKLLDTPSYSSKVTITVTPDALLSACNDLFKNH